MSAPHGLLLDRPGAGLPARLLALLRDGSDQGRARRFAAFAFAARLGNAALAFATQILLARWLGEREFGLYATAWVWVLTLGGMGSLGLSVSALKLVPDYRARGDLDGLRGFLLGSRLLGAVPVMVLAGLAAAVLWAWRGAAGEGGTVALVALAILPAYVLTDIQTGIARAYDFPDLGLGAEYALRPLLLLAFAASLALGLGGAIATAVTTMEATLLATGVTVLWQGLLLRVRLRNRVPAGPARLDLPRWGKVSAPLFVITALTLVFGATDILILSWMAGPEEVATYFAATKIVAVASFFGYGVANTSAHRFAAQFATGDRAELERLAAETVRWTFWPTLAVAAGLAACAGPLLSAFGPGFTSGARAVAILALGLVAGAAVGPADRALSMAEDGPAAARIFALAAGANALLCLALVPWFGMAGAALGTALVTALRAILLHRAVRLRLGLDMRVGRGAKAA